MKSSTDRILTSHAGSLPRPADLLELYRSEAPEDALNAGLRKSVADVVRKQIDAGITVVNDGEFGKPMSTEIDYAAWATYVYDRLDGFEVRQVDPAQVGPAVFRSKDRHDFAEFYQSEGQFPGARTGAGRAVVRRVNTGPIAYKGGAQVARDVANLQAALEGTTAAEGFMSTMVPTAGGLMRMIAGETYYKSPEELATAMADAMREEYKTIVDGGLNVQIDDPWLPSMYDSHFSKDGDRDGFLKWAGAQVELVNYALKGIPQEKVRYHVCWGSWHGPHSSDIPMRDVVEFMLKINASQFSFEAANVRHEHEWKIWRDVKLPEGKTLMPGVVSHSTNVLEHPELVADRIVRLANLVGRENVIAGTDCGLGGRIHEQLVWAKLRSLSEGAALASKELWS